MTIRCCCIPIQGPPTRKPQQQPPFQDHKVLSYPLPRPCLENTPKKMASRNTLHWEAPRFSFSSQNQADTRALDFLETLDINPDEEDQGKKGWCQIKMMFEGDNHQALPTLSKNNNISSEAQCTPTLALNMIQSVIKRRCQFLALP